jgi:hypothetical protein
MIDAASRVQNRAVALATTSSGDKGQPSRSQSFASQLSEELSGKSQSASQTAALIMHLPVRQPNGTGRNPGGAPQASGREALVSACDSATTDVKSTQQGTAAASQQPVSFDEAYWAKQPAAVQQLRDIQNPAERTEMAEQLAQKGYSIDVPIMVWGWDPAITTAARQSMGYTWVPSALQQPVEAAPGVGFAGATYDATHPPPGSITV